MPLRSVPITSLLASLVALTLSGSVVLVDVATDTSGEAMDAAAHGAAGLPLWLTLLFAVYFGLGRAQVASEAPTYARAIWLSLATAFVLIAVVATIRISYSGDPLLDISIYVPWLTSAVALALVLLPGSLLQAWLLRPRLNTSFERTREG
jgi:hypothetical protein